MKPSKGVIRYPIAVELGDDNHAYGIVVPDVPGAFTAGDTIDEAITNAKVAILMMLENYIERGEELPEPSNIEALKSRPEFNAMTLVLVDVDTRTLYVSGRN